MVDQGDTEDPRFAAFMAWRQENPAATFTMPLFGSDWEFPASQPAELVLYLAELRALGRTLDKIREDEFIELVHIVVPDETLAVWRRFPGLTEDDLSLAAGKLVARYRGVGGGAPGEAKAEATTSSTSSSSTGDSSNPTSTASTESKTSEAPSEAA